ncbi:MAG: amidase family protein [Clostridia bacterium]
MAQEPGFRDELPIWAWSATDLVRAMEEGRLSSVDIVTAFLDRIGRHNRDGAGINAVRELDPTALFQAAALDRERAEGRVRGPLHGVPVLLKDNIATSAPLHTTAGSVALDGMYGTREAPLVRRLRRAGVLILGKTNLTEWANFMTQHMPNGYSSLGGQVMNPFAPGRFDVGGSSSGSGAAVASGFAPLAIGTETSGSILSPASSNGIVGIKPTVGLVSRTAIIPISPSQDTAGPMTGTVADAALLLAAIMGPDRHDAATWVRPPDRAYRDTLIEGIGTRNLAGVRIGVPREGYWSRLGEAALTVLNDALRDLVDLGGTVVDPVSLPHGGDLWDFTVLVYEFKPALNAYLADLPAHAPVHSMLDVIHYNRSHAARALRYGQVWFEQAQALSGSLTEARYLHTRQQDLRLSRTEGIDRALADHGLQVLAFPGTYGAGIAAKAGYPSITVPAGYTEEDGPIGITFTGPAYSEPTLVRVAAAFEASADRRRRPPLDG